MTNEKILLQLERGYDITNPQLAQALSNLETKISEGGGGTDIPEEVVLYTPQTLDITQQAQVRTNIGVLSPDELLDSNYFLSKLSTKLGLDVEN